jgi:hypothetical protein
MYVCKKKILNNILLGVATVGGLGFGVLFWSRIIPPST